MKKLKHTPSTKYEDIHVPKNTAVGAMIGVAALAGGFGLIWHIWWLAIIGVLTVVILLIIRLTSDDTERVITAKEVATMERAGVGTA